MSKNISFTVFIPCYGKCSHLEQTIQSLADQDYPLDVVLCPQGDTNVDEFEKKYGFIRILRLEKPSLYRARIFLFDKSESDYIYYLDDDDILPKGLFKYISSIIQNTKYLDLYRIPLKTFNNDSYTPYLREQNFSYNYLLQSKKDFLACCFNGTYHNGVVHLFIKNCLHPKWFDVDIFQTEDRLITYSIVNAVNTDICVIEDAFYLYRKYPESHSKTLGLLRGRDDFITANDCLKDFMDINDLILNSYAIILRVTSYLKYLNENKTYNKENFIKIYSNERIWYYLEIYVKNFSLFKKIVGYYVSTMTKLIYKKKYRQIRILIKIKCLWEKLKYGRIEY